MAAIPLMVPEGFEGITTTGTNVCKIMEIKHSASYGDEDELTTHAPSHEEDKRQLQAITQHDSGDDNEGDLPPDLTRSVPPTPGNYAWPPLDEPAKQVQQPIAVQLNEA
jgi:hypothetical protein